MEASLSFDPRRLRIGALLLRGGLLDAEQLAEALDEKEVTGERLGQIVLRRGWVTEEALAQALADQSGLDFVDLDTATRESRADLLLSGKLARYFRCVPLAVLDEQTVLVAASDPTSPLLADLPSAIDHEIRVAVATETAVERVLAVIDPDGAAQTHPPLLDQPAASPALDPLVEPSGEPLLRLSVVSPAPTDAPEPAPEVEAETTPEHEDTTADTSQPEPPWLAWHQSAVETAPDHMETTELQSEEPEHEPADSEPEQAYAPLPEPEPWLTWPQPAAETQPDHTDDPAPQPAELQLEEAAPQPEPERSWLAWHEPAVEGPPDHTETTEIRSEEPENESAEPELAYALLPEPEPWLTWPQPAAETRPEHTDDPAPQPAEPEPEQHEALPGHEEPALEERLPSWLEVSQSDLSEADQRAAGQVEAEPERPWSLWLTPLHDQRPELTLPAPAESEEEPAVADAEIPAPSSYEAGPDGDSDPVVAAANEMIAGVPVSLLEDRTPVVPELEEPVVADEAPGETDPLDETVTHVDGRAKDDAVATTIDGEPSLDDAEASEFPPPRLRELWSRGSQMAGKAEDSVEPDESGADATAAPAEEAAADPEPEGSFEPDVGLVEPDPDATAPDPPEVDAEAEGMTDLEQLGLGPEAVTALRAALDQPHGLVLAVGPAVSGRTTTLRTALDVLEEASRAVLAVEGGSTQGRALRMALQADPGIVLIDDLEHPGTARAAVEAALRGHLVLSTLHAPTPGSAVARLTGAGIERQVLAATLTCVVGQRLARRLCPSCREPYEAGRSSLIASGFGDTYLPASPFVGVYEPRGCSECDGGYAGRIGLFEVLSVSAPVRRILETGNASDIDGAAAYGGTRTLLADGLRHCLAGRTTLAEVRRVVGARPV